MDVKHANEVMELVKMHFSKATDGDAQIVWADVRGCEFDDAQSAILAHRREKGAQAWRPDIQRIKSLAFSAMNDRRRARSSELRIIDFIRGVTPSAGNMEARDAIIHHFATAWAKVEESGADPRGILLARAYIRCHCRQALRQIGITEDEAEMVASDCVDLKPKEKLSSVGIFNIDWRTNDSWSELRKLAISESNTVGVGDGI